MNQKTSKLIYELRPYLYMVIGLISLFIPSDVLPFGLSHIVLKIGGGLLITYGVVIQQKRGRFRSAKHREEMQAKHEHKEENREQRSQRNLR